MDINIPLFVIFFILIIHWIADFILQTSYEAENKSKNFKALLSHTFTYSTCWFIILFPLGIYRPNETTEWYVVSCFTFIVITFILHTITDYYTSRLNSKLWASKQVHNFFVSIGGDQILHYVQLFLTYYFITKY